jgi:hypothetical protein
MKGTKWVVVVTMVLCGLVVLTSSAAAQVKIAKCQIITAPGSYVLTANLSPTSFGNCLTVTANFVTIDLNGFTIDCGGIVGEGVGAGSNFQGTTVQNGTITNCFRGVNVNGDNALVERVRAVSNTFQGINVGHASIVKDSLTSQNGGDGISVFFNSLVSGNTSFANGGNGIVASNGSSVIGNAVGSNTGHGVFAALGTVAKNTSLGNQQNGYRIICPSNVFDNMARGNIGGNYSFDTGFGACNTSNNFEP